MGFEGLARAVETGPESSKKGERVEQLNPPTPGRVVSRHLLWESRVIQGTSEEVGVKTPEGGYVRLRKGEHFAVLRDREKDSYQAIVRDDEGNTLRVLEEGTIGKEDGGVITFHDGEAIEGHRVVRVLEEAGEAGKIFARAYVAAVEEFPELREIDITLGDPDREPVLKKTGGFARHQSQSPTGRPLVVVNARLGVEHYRNLMQERRVSARISAEKAGIDPDKLTPEMLATFIFLHEVGHGYHYLKEMPDGEAYRKRRKEELASMPIPGWNPGRLALALEAGGELDAWYSKNEKIFARKGLPTRESVVEAQERAYHSISTEDSPDQFASKVMQKHFAQLFQK